MSFFAILKRFMTKFFIEDKTGESIEVFDTETITPGMMSEYKAMLALATHRKAAMDFLQAALAQDDTNWKVKQVLQRLSEVDEQENDVSYQALISACKAYNASDLRHMPQVKSMAGLTCFRAGIDAGAGFLQGSINILGTEGLIDCVALAVHVSDKGGRNCYYLAYLSGHRKTKGLVEEELTRILNDINHLTQRDLAWSDLQGCVTLIGDISAERRVSLAYQHIFSVLDKQGVAPAATFANSVAIVGDSGQLILNPVARLVEGEQAKVLPTACHGRFAPLKTKHAEHDHQAVRASSGFREHEPLRFR